MMTVPCCHFRTPRQSLLVARALLTLVLILVPLCVRADRTSLALVPRGASGLTRVRPQELSLSQIRPVGVKRVPKGITAPYYTMIQLGPKEQPSRFAVLVDAPEGKPSRLYVDANGNGDFLDDPAAEWTHKTYAGRENEHLLMSVGGATVQVRYGQQTVPMHVTLSRYDTSEPTRAARFLPVYCTADYGREGTVTLGGKPYHIWLADALTRGDYRGSGVPGQSGIFLLIDVNGNGRIDARGETYDASEPFNIGGVTYELLNIEAMGASVEIVKSARRAAEILPPPDLGIGKLVVPFQANTTDGHTVRFPADYKKKFVLLYFWATWCGDCSRDAPYLAHAYKTFHSAGLEVLGISLDHADQAPQLASFTKQHGMDWPQIYDGKVWDAAIAQLYYVMNTPTALLVDGDSGAILAKGQDLLGDHLAETLAKHLKAR